LKRRSLLLACGLAACGLLAGCRSDSVGPFPSASVVLVSVDTLRADRLPLYGYAKGATPHLDALGREAVVFERAYSHCPLTLPAHASLLTGLLPPHHGVRDNQGFSLGSDKRTLAARFRAAGFDTGAAVSAYVIRAATGISQGFDVYDDAFPVDASVEALAAQQRDGGLSVDSLIRWIEARPGSKRFFAFLHLYEPHAPYTPPPAYQRLPDPYDGEIAYADELVGRLVARLRDRGLLERTILAVTSDHGEGLGDHGEQEHGFFLYREAVHVPLIVRLPGGARGGTRIAGAVGQVDVPATLLDLAGLPADGMDGRSQRLAIEKGAVEPRPVYAETFFPRYHFGWSELLAVTDDRYRYIHAPRPELYDAKADPSERVDLASQRADTARSMGAWLETAVGRVEAVAPSAVPAAVAENLRALGYVGGGVRLDTRAGPLPDPKDKVGVYEAYRRAGGMHSRGQDEEAVRELRTVLADTPGMVDAWHLLGLALFRLGRLSEATAALDEVVKIEPTHAGAHLALARIGAGQGQWERALRHAEVASVSQPGEAFETLAELMLRKDRLREAAEYARRSLDADRSRVLSAFVLGEVARRQGRCDEAVASYREAIESQRLRRGLVVRSVHAGLADCLARLGQEAESEKEFLAEIEAIPYSREGRTGLAILYRSQGRDVEARGALEGIVTANPRAGADEYWAVVRTLATLGDAAAARQWSSRGRARFPSDPRFRPVGAPGPG
jgi:arylsulfatase A-like enzyme/Tfp pilus assembly protein PilF